MRAPLAPFPPPVTASSFPSMSAFDFCLLTTIWEDPKELEAGRLAADMLTSWKHKKTFEEGKKVISQLKFRAWNFIDKYYASSPKSFPGALESEVDRAEIPSTR